MNMNKILLVLIISCGILLIFYANNDIFTRRSLLDIFKRSRLKQEDQLVRTDIDGDPVHHQDIGIEFISSTTGQLIKYEHFFNDIKRVKYMPPVHHANGSTTTAEEYNIFIIYSKETEILKTKFELFLKSLLKYTSVHLHLHLITDGKSEESAEEILKEQIQHYHKIVFYSVYNVEDFTTNMTDITQTMLPHFSSASSSYYSDPLFFLSLGLYRTVDPNMRRAILIDCDIVFRTDVKRLFNEFNKFSSTNLFGLAPELTPVYRHILYKYRAKNPNTNFGNPYYLINPVSQLKEHRKLFKQLKSDDDQSTDYQINNKINIHKHGFPGLNSGIILLDFTRIRNSRIYADYLKSENITYLTKKYTFKGHLGDQDFYTIFGYEYPTLIYQLDCIWNRQLCTWWKEHGYSDIFDEFFRCDGKIKIYHGNCNTRIPE